MKFLINIFFDKWLPNIIFDKKTKLKKILLYPIKENIIRYTGRKRIFENMYIYQLNRKKNDITSKWKFFYQMHEKNNWIIEKLYSII